MRCKILIVLLVLTSLSLTGTAKANDSPYKEDELLVCFAETSLIEGSPIRQILNGPLTDRVVKNVISNFLIPGAVVGKEYDRIKRGLSIVKLPKGTNIEAAVLQFSLSGDVLYAEPNYKRQLAARYPSDPSFWRQWALHNTSQFGGALFDADIDAPEAWDISIGDPAIIVAVLDTGLDYSHEDINDNLWINTGEDNAVFGIFDPNDLDGVDGDGNGYIDDIIGIDPAGAAQNTLDPDGDPLDVHYHGTHVAGIIGAQGNNGIGVTGVCWEVAIMPLKIFADDHVLDPAMVVDNSPQQFFDTDVFLAINYAIIHDANIINASWGGPGFSQSLYYAIRSARDAGILFVAAAGDSGSNNDSTPYYPANYNTYDPLYYPPSITTALDNVISVMATDYFDNMPAYSNYGPTTVDLGAPGGDMNFFWGGIYNLLPTTVTPFMTADNIFMPFYGELEGTSFAAPHVSGACALLWSINPNLTYQEIKTILMLSVDPVLPGLCVSGGRLNLGTAAKMTYVRPNRVMLFKGVSFSYFDYIQDAIDAAVNGDEIIASKDEWYFETIDVNGKDIHIRSGDIGDFNTPLFGPNSPSDTYISGAFDTGRTVTFNSSDANLVGFTIIHGADGGIDCNNASPEITKCIITNNTKPFSSGTHPNFGGGIYCKNGATPTIMDCNITNNIAFVDGGGIYYSISSSVNITDCNILNNTTIFGEGGGIYSYNSSPTITGCNLIGNTAGGAGGGFYSYNSPSTITNCNVIGNTTGDEGGGIYSYNSSTTITNCNIDQNISQWEGGGIYCDNISPTIRGCNITQNIAQRKGGGIYFDSGAHPDIQNSVIRGNIATYNGGGIYCNFVNGLIKNCLIVDNTVESWDGGAVFCSNGSPTIANCTFAGNAGNLYDGKGGVLYGKSDSDPELIDCIFSENKGPAIYEEDTASDVDVSFSLFYDNTGGDYYDKDKDTVYDVNSADPNGLDAQVAEASDNIGKDPMFVTGRLGDYYLSQYAAGQRKDANGLFVIPSEADKANSPAVDKGSNVADHPSIGMDIYSTRTDNINDLNMVDMGYHYNDPNYNAYDPNNLVTLYVSYFGSGTGTAIFSPPQPLDGYRAYAHVYLTANASPDSQFRSWLWTDDDTLYVLDPGTGFAANPQHNFVTMTGNQVQVVAIEFETLMMELLANVIGGTGGIKPRSGTFFRGTVVNLTATPAVQTDAIIWSGTDDDFSILRNNTVTMDEDPKIVNVQFYPPQYLYVGPNGNYATIQQAIDAANNRDIVEIAPSTTPYTTSWGFLIDNKAITIQSSNPDDPNTVALTVIQQDAGPGGSVRGAFRFLNVGRNTVLNGITLRGWWSQTPGGLDGNSNLNAPPGSFDGVPAGPNFGKAITCGIDRVTGALGPASPTIKNCVIIDCNAIAGDGGDGANGNSTDHVNGGNGGWPGAALGGALACFWNSSPAIINCRFENCFVQGGNGGDGGNGNSNPDGAGGRGGGYYYNYTIPQPWFWGPFELASPSDFSGRGGAVYVDPFCFPTFTDCNFINCSSNGGTNGICGVNGFLPGLIDEPSIYWKIDNFGGAAYIATLGGATFENCTFVNNTADTNTAPDATDNYVSHGGAVAFEDGANVTFKDCTFNGNIATSGGALYWTESGPIITNCSFVNNSALTGGGLYFVGGTSTIMQSSFSQNQATGYFGAGGAICAAGANAAITDCQIFNNDANSSGGGIYVSSKDASGATVSTGDTVLIKNCLITGNTATRDGGGISANWSSDPNIINCTIADNTVTGTALGTGYGGGVYCGYGNYTQILNSILWNNYADAGRQINIGTSYEYDPKTSAVEISYSDVQGGAVEPAVYIDTGDPGTGADDSVLIWDYATNLVGAANNDSIPQFVGNSYYLGQPITGDVSQDVLSPCVNAGNNEAHFRDMYKHTTRTDGVIDDNAADMGYHYLLSSDLVGDFNYDGVIDGNDTDRFSWHWIETGCVFPDWCHEKDLNKDGVVNFLDFALFAQNYGNTTDDTTPPTPNPMTWEEPPYSAAGANWISMTATLATDNSGGAVYYFFQCVDTYGVDIPGHFQPWSTNRMYYDDGLTPGDVFGYKVRAGDAEPNDLNDPSDPNTNKTGWSAIGYAIVGQAGAAGAAEPPDWVLPPIATSNSITLEATTSDSSGISYLEYEFDVDESISGPNGTDSGRQTSEIYTDSGLDPNTTYYYRVRAIDENNFMTNWSAWIPVTTLPPGAPPGVLTAPVLLYSYPAPSAPDLNSGQYQDGNDFWWHKIVVDTTFTNALYCRFICVDVPGLSSDWELIAGIGTIATGPLGPPSAFITYGFNLTYDVPVREGGTSVYRDWRVCVSNVPGGGPEQCTAIFTILPPP